jgi:predicted aspartyl protease
MKQSTLNQICVSALLVITIIACSGVETVSDNKVKSPAKPSPGSHQGLPQPQVMLQQPEVNIPFELNSEFPVPVIEMQIAGQGPYRFVVDTGTSGAFVLRKQIVDTLPTRLVGYALMGDGSGKAQKRAPVVLIDSARSGDLVLKNIMTVAIEPSADHAASIPDDLDGIIGMELFKDYLLTLDYQQQEVRIAVNDRGLIGQPGVNSYDYSQKAIIIDVNVAGIPMKVFVDSGHRGTLTLPSDHYETLRFREPLKNIEQVATVTNTYSRQAGILDGNLHMAGVTVENPPLIIADDHSAHLLGNGILKYFSITIDQQNQLIKFDKAGDKRIQNVELFSAGISNSL